MKRTIGALLVAGGVGLVLLGLLFLLGAAGQGSRYVIAVISLALGGLLMGVGLRIYRQGIAASPETLRAEILALAHRQDGEISWGEVEAALGSGIGAVLQAMEEEGLCQCRRKDNATYYVFQSLQPRLMVRRCEYCKAELPFAEEVAACPNCGGTVKTQKESRSLSSGDHYSMDP